jgi:hypothetical protein
MWICVGSYLLMCFVMGSIDHCCYSCFIMCTTLKLRIMHVYPNFDVVRLLLYCVYCYELHSHVSVYLALNVVINVVNQSIFFV